ncbi:hypothetical protein ACFL4T_08870 [candidate division KSB1 bacterium]
MFLQQSYYVIKVFDREKKRGYLYVKNLIINGGLRHKAGKRREGEY